MDRRLYAGDHGGTRVVVTEREEGSVGGDCGGGGVREIREGEEDPRRDR
ncbi:MAG: hypothetical protein AVDCRST_MAG12-1771 [uncultured Rubrobacteraceae bacterium]|uniref:Uncharacterized protein n=1 Tax=uncultured Rubrobacteraceae bacterium TaxID=349277 RepID=A0A6J4RZ07_9ACTN|nr:MAG: hypothetical protein AVDCRST_MAG12-1771 [uncultured Rubrobacteraceae bacterium]